MPNYCQIIAKLLTISDQDIAKLLLSYCQVIAKLLSSYCQAIVELLQVGGSGMVAGGGVLVFVKDKDESEHINYEIKFLTSWS